MLNLSSCDKFFDAGDCCKRKYTIALNIKDLQIHSPAFTSLEHIPKQYTSDGENISPPLGWSGLPAGTQQLALICHDPDAPLPQGFTHWLIYGIGPTINQIASGGDSKFTEGVNSTNQPGYTDQTKPVCILNTCTHRPVRSHCLTVWSSLPLNKVCPSALNTIERTQPVCASQVKDCCPSVVCHREI